MATLTTQLEAVNTMLSYISESSVASIPTDLTTLPPSAEIAVNLLAEVSREVQAEGWHFNTVKEHELTVDGDSKFPLPTNTIDMDANDASLDVVQRGLFVYDRKNRTDVFTTSTLKVDITYLLDFDQLIEQARRYITLRAARMLQARLVGSRELENLIIRDEMLAKARLEDVEGNSSDRTIFSHYDTASRVGINRNYSLS